MYWYQVLHIAKTHYMTQIIKEHGYKLEFHMEHMPIVWDPAIIEAAIIIKRLPLADHKVVVWCLLSLTDQC